jgi:hypothetical protein
MAAPAALVEEARRLYVADGLTLAQIAERLAGQVSDRTLADWSASQGWVRLRQAHQAKDRELGAYYVRIRLALAKMTVDENGEVRDFDPQKAYALRQIADAIKPAPGTRPGADPDTQEERFARVKDLLEDLRLLEAHPEAMGGLAADDAASRVLTAAVLRQLAQDGAQDPKALTGYLHAVADLQRSNAARAKIKKEIEAKAKNAAEEVAKEASAAGLSPDVVRKMYNRVLEVPDV